MVEKCFHFGFSRNLRPSGETAALKWFATASCMPSFATIRKQAARSIRIYVSSGAVMHFLLVAMEKHRSGSGKTLPTLTAEACYVLLGELEASHRRM